MVYPGVSILPPIYTDASSTIGFGGLMGNQWFAGRWPTKVFGKINIATLELYPIYLALMLWTKDINNSTIYLYTDNHALVSAVNKLYAKDPALLSILRPMALHCLSQNLLLRCHHVPGKDNIGADALSRDQISTFLSTNPDCKDSRVAIPNALLPDQCGLLF
jgi:hypothetical protein